MGGSIIHERKPAKWLTFILAFTVAAGEYYANGVYWASANGIVSGYGNSLFGPNDPITREQMAAILYRYAQYKEYDTTVAGDVSSFTDGTSVSSYAVEPMNWAVGTGLLSGIGNNMLNPTGNATRAEVSTILMRFCEINLTPPVETYTVTFDYNYGGKGAYKTIEVNAGDVVIKPANPHRSGYTLDGWYTKASGGKKFDFNTAITSDITLYAKWSVKSSGNNDVSETVTPTQPTTYTVTFDSNGGSEVVAQIVKNGSTATPPANPAKEGYVFGGWHTAPWSESLFDFSTSVNRDIILYAFWIDERLDDEEDICYDVKLTDISFDDKSNITYANNIILLYIDSDLSDAYCQRLINAANGSFAGRLKGSINIWV